MVCCIARVMQPNKKLQYGDGVTGSRSVDIRLASWRWRMISSSSSENGWCWDEDGRGDAAGRFARVLLDEVAMRGVWLCGCLGRGSVCVYGNVYIYIYIYTHIPDTAVWRRHLCLCVAARPPRAEKGNIPIKDGAVGQWCQENMYMCACKGRQLAFYSLSMSQSSECVETLRVLRGIKDATRAESAHADRVAEWQEQRYQSLRHVLLPGRVLSDACALADSAHKDAMLAKERARVAAVIFDTHPCNDT